MPYGISDKQSDCAGWATVKQTADGYETVACHNTKQEAVDQMVAISIDEDMEPLGNVTRAAKDQFRTGDFVTWRSSGGSARGRIERIERDGSIDVPDSSFTIKGTPDDPAALIRVYQKQDDGFVASDTLVGHRFSTLRKIDDLKKPTKRNKTKETRNENLVFAIDVAMNILAQAKASYLAEEAYEEEEEMEDEERQAPSLVAPAFMRASARRGLQLLEEGFSSVSEKGLKQQTVNDARKMANGEALSAEKWRKISPWIARHIVDLDAVKDEPTPGLVAMLLWGGGSSKSSARRAQQYAERIVEKLDSE